jgi:hypothetical protein
MLRHSHVLSPDIVTYATAGGALKARLAPYGPGAYLKQPSSTSASIIVAALILLQLIYTVGCLKNGYSTNFYLKENLETTVRVRS